MDDFSALQSNVSAALISTTRSAANLASEDLSFHRSLDSTLGSALDKQNARLLGLAERLLGVATANTETVRPPRLRDLESVDGNWKAVVDVVDSLLERADTALDEFTGAVRRLSPGADQATTSKPTKYSKIAASLKSQDLRKPQLDFEYVPTNKESRPFKPLLLTKPHALFPLEDDPKVTEFGGQPAYSHPYQAEIEQYQYPLSVYTYAEPIPYHPFETTTATLVDTEEAVDQMLQELKQATEIAIDLEHHDNRSYIGIVSLMQISTRDKDWIVDTLKPWRRKLHCLNEVFADPGVLKVLHGAYMDIVWLQRDLGLYIVGLFDTHYAARALGYPGLSLAYLLKRFVNVDAQKQYQTADWRIRPLPQELFDYARSDTHYLLYIFDCMRNELIDRSNLVLPNHEGDKLWDVLQRSSETALQQYEHPVYDVESGQGNGGWYRLITRTPAQFSKEQFSVFRGVHKWRDDVAREQDDSVHYTLPNHHIFSLAREMPLNKADLFGLVQPTTQTVRLRADELISTISKAKNDGQGSPEMQEILDRIEPPSSRRSMPQTKPVQTQTSDAGLLTPQVPTVSGTTSSFGLPIRIPTSSFWGKAFESSAWGQKRAMSGNTSVSLSVPLPPLTAEVFADPSHSAAVEAQRDPTPETDTSSQQKRTEDDDVFVLKDLHKKRKLADSTDNMAIQSDEVALDTDPEAIHRQTKADKKRAKRAAKLAAKSSNNGVPSADSDVEQAFDYASAPSILHPPREPPMSVKERKQREKQMNPYAKAMDASKGLPRVQKERAGRSMTFKS